MVTSEGDVTEFRVKIDSLKEKCRELADLDASVFESLVSADVEPQEDEVIEEMEAAQSYQDRQSTSNEVLPPHLSSCRNISFSQDRGTLFEELDELGIVVADFSEEDVDIFIGTDFAGKLFTGRKKKLKCGLVAVETLLGWTLMAGNCSRKPASLHRSFPGYSDGKKRSVKLPQEAQFRNFLRHHPVVETYNQESEKMKIKTNKQTDCECEETRLNRNGLSLHQMGRECREYLLHFVK
ncbi:hypothetical protein GE061_011222 [Apolygus lucorum]|uniref:Uncharacterized protein n=1 Tax=Apolygus lucorum TaxID=248454 RepID=A0A8S9XWP8_APOLU|nr:hypothetical protein GE061_011222 [Apolygus lucorum]